MYFYRSQAFILAILFLCTKIAFAGLNDKLFSAVINNKEIIVKEIINDNPELLNIQDATGRTPIRWAYHRRNIKLVGWLTKKGAIKDIIFSSETGDLNKVKELIKSNSELIHFRDKIGKTPLHWASLYGHTDVVKFLVGSGANLNAIDNKKSSILHHAVSTLGPDDKSEIINILVKGDINIDPINNQGKTPLHSAVTLSSNEGTNKMVSVLLQNDADVNTISSSNDTPLCSAIRYSRLSFVKLLVRFGADVNRKCKEGNTPLHVALKESEQADRWDYNIFEILLNNGSDINIKNDEGVTPLEIAGNKFISRFRRKQN